MLDGSVQPDTGSIVVAPNTVIRQLRQDVPTGMEGTVHDIVAAGVAGADVFAYDGYLSDVRTMAAATWGLDLPPVNSPVIPCSRRPRSVLSSKL